MCMFQTGGIQAVGETLSSVIIAAIAFPVSIVLERCGLWRVIGFDLRKESPPAKEILAKFGWVKFPRTLFNACLWASLPLPIEEKHKLIVFVLLFILYFLWAFGDTMVAMQFITLK